LQTALAESGTKDDSVSEGQYKIIRPTGIETKNMVMTNVEPETKKTAVLAKPAEIYLKLKPRPETEDGFW
jgi:hypothetical protein